MIRVTDIYGDTISFSVASIIDISEDYDHPDYDVIYVVTTKDRPVIAVDKKTGEILVRCVGRNANEEKQSVGWRS